MTQYQKRLLIAEASGYKWWPSPHNLEQSILAKSQEDANSVNIGLNTYHLVPDYFNSRDTCMEVILGLNPIKRQDFIHALVMIVSPDSQWHDMHLPELFNFLTATPEQLCEALGSTLNIW